MDIKERNRGINERSIQEWCKQTHMIKLKFQCAGVILLPSSTFFCQQLCHQRDNQSINMDANNSDNDEDMTTKKRKTTYNREHPTDNPKPAKRTKAEIQAAAAEKKAAAEVKKQDKLREKEATLAQKARQRKNAMKDVAAMEDTVQRQHKQRQLQAERPDWITMQTYKTTIEASVQNQRVKSASRASSELEKEAGSDVELPPTSAVDTDSDGGLLGMEEVNMESGEESDGFIPFEDDEDRYRDDEEISDPSLEEMYMPLNKKRDAKKKVSLFEFESTAI